MLRNGLEPWHIVILVLVIALLFGWKKMPDMARSFGRSARILRSEVDEMKNDKKAETTASVNSEAQPANAEQHATPASPAASAPGVRVERDVPTKEASGHNSGV